ncbi:MAG TPA: protease inhibitor I42 family protein [Terriglobia bacterium]|nr:protease inhibitor I42 family protein [Terriglobia bacterium]
MSAIAPLWTPALAQAAVHSSNAASGVPEHVTAAALWRPGDATLKEIRLKCGPAAPRQYGQCFLQGMQEHGAPPAAIAFARSLAAAKGGTGYMEDFTQGGRVAVAHVAFIRRDGWRQGWLLVNGSPSPVDVDDLSLLPLADVRSDIVFQEIRRTYSRASVFAELRLDASPPLVPRAGEAEEFLVNYALLDGCRTCKRLGSAQFAFDFEGNGSFEGVTLRGVWMTPEQGTLAPVSLTKDFHVHLVADHSAGYRWRLAAPLDERFVSLVSTTYSAPEARSGTPGVEDWVFHPWAAGRTIIRFEKLRAGEKNLARDRRFFVVVTVE